KITDLLRGMPKPFRVRFDTAGMQNAYPTLYGIEEFGGYDAVYPKRFKAYLDDLDRTAGSRVDAMLGCGAAAFRTGAPLPPTYVPIAEGEGLTIAMNRDALPRARLVESVVSFPSAKAMFDAMNEPDFDPRGSVYTDAAVDFSLPPPDGTPCGDATIVAFEHEHVRVRANAKKECVLVLADGFAPGWEVTVDGLPARTFPAYYLYRGVHLAPGKHTIAFDYRPLGFRIGLIVSCLGMAVSAVVALAMLRGIGRKAECGLDG
ncbi:MAG: YfhO family protein, partial [Candidatus Hydrogenedentes bacterium]|nr:YfhO family protein [Candidatus Hydrogenedentota bacterium]